MTDAVGRAATRAASYAAICVLTVCAGSAVAKAETRTLKIYHLHTHEKEEIAYKKDGRYIPDGLKRLNWILRDWRKEKPVNMDPRLLDLIWEAYRQSGSRAYINVVCGYRSAETNGMLRSRTSGVAKESQHMLGKAMDFYLPDVSLAKLRAIGLKMQIGGVGYYPTSGSPFVHFDVGNVRHWPRMNRRELLAVFPNGNTVHVPSDGKPLPGYEQALASYKARKGASSIEVANAGAAPAASSSGGGKTLFAMLFGGGGADEEEDNAESDAPAAKPSRVVREAPKPAPVETKPAREETVAVAALAAPPKREVLPNGVPLPIRDTFDTSAPKAPIPPAPLKQDEKAAEAEPTEVAALDLSRIPLPSAAPIRETVAVAEAMKVPVPSAPAAEAMVAALETAPKAEEDVAAKESGQLAYAVPTPRSRPPFASILKDETPARSDTSAALSAIIETAEVETPAAAAPAPSHASAAIAAVTAPAPVLAMAPPPVLTKHADKLVLASLAPPVHKASETVAANPAVIPEGKTGRFKRHSPAESAKAATSETRVVQKAVSDRIRMANLVTDPNTRREVAAMGRPNATVLVRNAPTSVLAAGFTSQPVMTQATYSFAGSAVNFMPMIKVD
uniref:DUF882 domain-containing protein n=1 Tax=Aureimonas endophytica TaxID=2027858 RepID=UPI001FCF11D0|nr:DUF882 domain-containing protein [Aureimonas endophytica]